MKIKKIIVIVSCMAVIISSLLSIVVSADDAGGNFFSNTLTSYNNLVEMQFNTSSESEGYYDCTVGSPFSLYRVINSTSWNSTDYFKIYYGNGITEELGFTHYITTNQLGGTPVEDGMANYWEDTLYWSERTQLINATNRGIMFRYENFVQKVGHELNDTIVADRTAQTYGLALNYEFDIVIPQYITDVNGEEVKTTRFLHGIVAKSGEDYTSNGYYYFDIVPDFKDLVKEGWGIDLREDDEILVINLKSGFAPVNSQGAIDGNIVVNRIRMYMRMSNDFGLTAEDVFEDVGNLELIENTADADFSSWIVKAVGGFMDFQVFPGISIGVILAFTMGLGMIFMVLRFMAGG